MGNSSAEGNIENLHERVEQPTLALPEGGTTQFNNEELGAFWSYMEQQKETISNGPSALRSFYQKVEQIIPQGVTSS